MTKTKPTTMHAAESKQKQEIAKTNTTVSVSIHKKGCPCSLAFVGRVRGTQLVWNTNEAAI